jgi:hypothetical protein
MSTRPAVVSNRSTSEIGTQHASAASLPAWTGPPSGRAPIHHAGDAQEPHRDPALLEHLAAGRLRRGLPEVDEAARDAPLARRGIPAPPDQKDAVAVEDDGAHADAGVVRILARGR